MRKDSRAAQSDAADESTDSTADEAVEAVIHSPRRWSQGLILLLGGFGLQRLASFTPGLVESLYSSFLYQYIIRIISLLNKPFSYSLAEISLLLLLAALGVWLLTLVLKVWNGRLAPVNLFVLLVYRSLWVGGALLMLFLFLWGFNYQREVLATNLRLQGRETRPGELEAICNLMITRLNTNYDAARARQNWVSDGKVPLSRAQLYAKIEQSYQSLKLLGRTSQGGFGPPKPLLLSALLSRFGVSGIYSPFTGEANYNDESPACDLPYVIAHEKAHQRGYAREDEANFIGFLVCINATDPFIRYSGYLQAMPRVMNVLALTNEDEYRALVPRIGDGPRADLQGRAAFWNLRENRVLSEVARRTNHTYLRANRVRSGIANYDEVTALILNFLIAYPNGMPERQIVLPAETQDTPEAVSPTPAPRRPASVTPTPASEPKNKVSQTPLPLNKLKSTNGKTP